MSSSLPLALLAALAVAALGAPSPILLHNAALPGVFFPYVGLGTGGYGFNKNVTHPECWSEQVGCGETAYKAIKTWLEVGGVRVDDANSYYHLNSTGRAIRDSKVPRENMFILSKIGPAYPLGYKDTKEQAQQIKEALGTHVDVLLIHWPTSGQQGSIAPVPSSDPLCQTDKPSYDERGCRLNTWRAMVEVWQNGLARAVGVSNYNATHIMEIKNANLILPAVNQRPYNAHRSESEDEMRRLCAENKILFNGYSPLGAPDLAAPGGSRGSHVFPPEVGTKTLLEEPSVIAIAQRINATPAQVLLAWHWAKGVPTNPRSINVEHMKENLASLDITLSASDVAEIDKLKEGLCDYDPMWYECVPTKTTCPPQCCKKPPCPTDAMGNCCAAGDQ